MLLFVCRQLLSFFFFCLCWMLTEFKKKRYSQCKNFKLISCHQSSFFIAFEHRKPDVSQHFNTRTFPVAYNNSNTSAPSKSLLFGSFFFYHQLFYLVFAFCFGGIFVHSLWTSSTHLSVCHLTDIFYGMFGTYAIVTAIHK